MYPDLVGWIKVDGTPIDYPVMQDHTGGGILSETQF